jgi:hypothetical protein
MILHLESNCRNGEFEENTKIYNCKLLGTSKCIECEKSKNEIENLK